MLPYHNLPLLATARLKTIHNYVAKRLSRWRLTLPGVFQETARSLGESEDTIDACA